MTPTPTKTEPANVLDTFKMCNDVVVITGGLGQLGQHWQTIFLQAGAKVACLDLAPQPHQLFLDAQQSATAGQLMYVQSDITDKAALKKACQSICSTLGHPTVLINNAGIDQPPSLDGQTSYRLEDIPAEEITRVLDVNTTGAFCAMQVFGKAMIESGQGGSIINIGSLYASVSPDVRLYEHIECDPPFLKPPAYGASKAALINLTKYFAAHWGPQGIRVNALSPGGVFNHQNQAFVDKFNAKVPLGKMAQVDDLSGAMIFLASKASSYVNGIELLVDGGFMAW